MRAPVMKSKPRSRLIDGLFLVSDGGARMHPGGANELAFTEPSATQDEPGGLQPKLSTGGGAFKDSPVGNCRESTSSKIVHLTSLHDGW